MGAYDRFKNADPMGTRAFIEEGDHILLVKRTIQGPSTNPLTPSVEKTVVEFKIIKSTNEKMKPANMCSLVEVSSKQGYGGNVLSFVTGILGYTIDEMKADPQFDAVFAGCFGVDQILTEMLVRCTAQKVKTGAGGDYTAKSWEPIEAPAYEQYGLIAPDGAYVKPSAAVPG